MNKETKAKLKPVGALLWHAFLAVYFAGMVIMIIFIAIMLTKGEAHHSDPAPKPSDTRSALYVKAAPPAAQMPGYVCQNEVNNEMPDGWEALCYPLNK